MDADEAAGVKRSERRSRKPSALSILFLIFTAVDLAILFLVPHLHTSSNDAAGNAMSEAFEAIVAMIVASGLGLSALLFWLIPYRPIKIVLTLVQAGAALLISGLLG